jgi:hypothetical protein
LYLFLQTIKLLNMKNFTFLLLLIAIASLQKSFSQIDLLSPDQNPNYYSSKAKYMMMADSINKFHSTTVDNTYEAYDWYDAKQKRQQERIAFRRELRMERAKNRYNWDNDWYYGRYNNSYYNRYHQLNDLALPFLLFERWWR